MGGGDEDGGEEGDGGREGEFPVGVQPPEAFPLTPGLLASTSWLPKCIGRCGRWEVGFEEIKSEKSKHIVLTSGDPLPLFWPPGCQAGAVDTSVGRKRRWKCEDTC